MRQVCSYVCGLFIRNLERSEKTKSGKSNVKEKPTKWHKLFNFCGWWERKSDGRRGGKLDIFLSFHLRKIWYFLKRKMRKDKKVFLKAKCKELTWPLNVKTVYTTFLSWGVLWEVCHVNVLSTLGVIIELTFLFLWFSFKSFLRFKRQRFSDNFPRQCFSLY